MEGKDTRLFYRLYPVFLLLAALFLLHCAAPPPPSVTPRVPDIDDATILSGKIICLDPGHGGSDSGAVGKSGLRESDVNLQVSLALRDLLQQSGAKVVMTRTSDKAVSLPERVKINLQAKSDVFLSLHHNSSGSAMFNRTEIYYHYKEYGGASGDLSGELLRQFESLYDFPKSRTLVAYAYHVLRENEGTAILGEPSYLSDPFMEMRLKTPDGVQDEAWAYYNALRRYFSKGVPIVRYQAIAGNPSRITAHILDERSAIDPSSLRLTLNDEPLAYTYDASTGEVASAILDDLPGGTHTIRLICVNLNGNRSTRGRLDFRVERKPERIALSMDGSESNGLIRIKAFVSDQQGRSVADDTVVQLTASAPIIHAETHTTDGEAWFYLLSKDGAKVSVKAGPVSAATELNNGRWPARFTGMVLSTKDDTPVSNAKISSVNKTIVETDRNGWFALKDLPPGPIAIQAKGFTPASHVEISGATWILRLRPNLSGLLAGRKIYIDPEEGGDNTGALSASRVRASDVNLQTARALQEALAWAGAEGILAREDDRTLDSPTRARLSLASNSDLYLSILHGTRRGGESPEANVCRVFYRWDTAKPWAERMAPVIADYMGATTGGASQLVTQTLMHSHAGYCSVAVEPSYLTAPSLVKSVGTPAFARKEALAILYGLAEAFAQEREAITPAWRADRLKLAGVIIGGATPIPVANALVTLNGGLSLQSEPDGRFEFRYLAAGSYTLDVIAPGHLPAAVQVTLDELSAPLTVALTPKPPSSAWKVRD